MTKLTEEGFYFHAGLTINDKLIDTNEPIRSHDRSLPLNGKVEGLITRNEYSKNDIKKNEENHNSNIVRKTIDANVDNVSLAGESICSSKVGVKELLAYKRQRFHSMDSFDSIENSKAKRLVTKDGFVDIKYSKIPGLHTRFLTDIFHTMMDMKWRYIFLLFTISFVLSWVVFATAWYALIKFNAHKPEPCVDNVDTWLGAFLYSVETQTTIGYGGRAVTTNCAEGVILLVLQTIIGMFVNCAMLGLLFAKMARPKNRGKTCLFSKRAVISVRDGKMCLMFRYVDLRHKRLLDTNMRAVLIRPKLTKEGEFVPIDMADLKLTIDFKQEDYTLRLFPLFPLTVIHVIDEDSPLYTMSKSQLQQCEFELIPILEGTVPTTGNSTNVLTSYRPNEILWGHRFKPVFTGMHIGQNINRIDLSTLHDTYKESHTPDCSAEMFEKTTDADCCSNSSVSGYAEGSHGYQSSSTFNDFRFPKQTNHSVVHEYTDHVCIEINSESLHQLRVLKETTT